MTAPHDEPTPTDRAAARPPCDRGVAALPGDVDALRRLARTLLRVGADVDDALQGVALTALERPPRARTRSWLESVLRSRIGDQRRAARRRLAHEHAAARRDQAPATDEIVARLEAHARVTAAIRALGTDAREVVFLRYFDDLPPRRIAARLGLPVKTVKSRLHRALAELRRHLDDSGGARRSDARAWLVLLATPRSAATGALVLGGFELMKRVALALVLCLGLLGGWRVFVAPDPAPATGPAPTSAPRVANPSPSAGAPDRGSAEAGVQRIAAATTPDVVPPVVEPSSTGALVVHVAAADGLPAPDIALALCRGGPGIPPFAIDRVVTGPDGATPATRLAPGPYVVRSLWNRGGDDVDVAAHGTTELRIALPRGVEVTGEVVDPDARPVAGAAVWLQGTGNDWTGGVFVARTDALGTFHLPAVPRGISLGASAAGFAPTPLVDLDTLDAKAPAVHVRLQFGAVGGAVRGTVRDVRGAPVVAALVCVGASGPQFNRLRLDESWIEDRSPPSMSTDADGNFELVGLPLGEQPVAVRSAAHPLWDGRVTIDASSPAQLEIVLAHPARLTGVVRDEAGAPLAGALVAAFPTTLDTSYLSFGQIDYVHVFGNEVTTSDREGRYVLDRLAPGTMYAYAIGGSQRLAAAAVPHATLEFAVEPGAQLTWDPVLGDGHVLEGVVMFRDGTPMADAFVMARDHVDHVERVTTTDAAGRFRLVSVPDLVFTIAVQVLDLPDDADPVGKRGVRPDQGELRIVAPFDPPASVVAENAKPARVHGRIDDAAGVIEPRSALAVTLRSANRSWWTDVTIDGDRFTFARVGPGRYTPIVSVGDATVFVGTEFEVAAGGDVDLGVLRTEPPGAAELHFVRDAEVATAPLRVFVGREGAARAAEQDIGDATSIVAARLAPGRHEIEVLGPGVVFRTTTFEVGPGARVRVDVPVRAGLRCNLRVSRDPVAELGRLRVEVRDDQDAVVWHGSEFTITPAPFQRTVVLPVGRYRAIAEARNGPRVERAFVVERLDGEPLAVELDLR